MANRFWVGGSGTWNGTTTTNWSATSGGTSGASNPTAADDVLIDGSSGSPTITISGSPTCRSLTTTGATCTISMGNSTTNHLLIGDASGGAMTLSASTAFTGFSNNNNALQFVATSNNGGVGWPITTNGVTVPPVTFSGAGGRWQLQDNLTWTNSGSGLLILSQGTLDLNSKNLMGWAVILNTANPRSLIGGNCSITLLATSGTSWDLSANTNLTLSMASATIILTTASSNTRTFAGGNQTYGTLSYTVANSPGVLAITGANTFNTITVNAAKQLQFPASTINTVTNFNVNGTTNGYVYLPAAGVNYLSTPDSAALSITGDLDLRVDVAFDSLTPAGTQYIIAKDDGATGRSYSLRLLNTGGFNFLNSADGTVVSSRSSSATLGSVGIVNGQRLTVRVTYRNSDGRIQFWYGTTGVNGTFTQLGVNATATILGIFDSAAELAVGAISGGGSGPPAQYYQAQVRNNILDNGTGIQLDANFATKAVGVNSFTETSANAATVSINGVLAQAGDGRVAITSSTAGTAATLTTSGNNVVNVDYATIQDSTVTGGDGWFAGSNSTNVSGNTGWVFNSSGDYASDTLTTTESVGYYSDLIATRESYQVVVEANVNKSDTLTTTESKQLLVTGGVAVSDTLTTTESVRVLLVSQPAVSDTLTSSESITMLSIANVNVSNTLTTTESVQLLITGSISVSNTLTTTESVTVKIVYGVAQSDNLTLTESIKLLATSNIRLSDTLNLSESVQVVLVQVITINVSDTLTTTEFTQAYLVASPSPIGIVLNSSGNTDTIMSGTNIAVLSSGANTDTLASGTNQTTVETATNIVTLNSQDNDVTLGK